MKKGGEEKMKRFLSIIFALCTFFYMAFPAAANQNLENGTYTINYKVLKADNDSVSIANDYWEKPATLIVKDGKYTVQVKLNHSSWIKEFKVNNVETKVISSDNAANTRVAQFELNQVPDLVVSQIHVYIPEEEFPGIGLYDNRYTIRLKFDQNTIQAVQSKPEANANATNSAAQNDGNANQGSDDGKQMEQNPQTSDSTPLYLLIGLFALSGTVFVYKLKKPKSMTS